MNRLYDAFDKKGIVAFRDDKIVERGESISTQVVKAIEVSKVGLVILSSSFASSSWCLDELSKIMQWCAEMHVIPVFYNVNPTHVRKGRGDFEILLKPQVREHEEVYWENSDNQIERQHMWRDALKWVTNFTGWDLRDRYESD